MGCRPSKLQQLADQQQSQLQEQQWEITEMQRQLVALRVVKAAHGRSTQRRRQQHWQPPRPRDKADAIVAAQQRMGQQQQQQMVQQQQLSEEGEQLRGVWVVWHQLSAQRVKRVQLLQQYWQATALTISVRQWYQWAAERTDNRILSAQAQHMREVLQLRGAWSRWQQQPPSKLTWSQVRSDDVVPALK